MLTARRLARFLAAGPIGALLAVGLAVIPAGHVQAQTVVHTRAAEASGPLNGADIRQLAFTARDVAVHWAGNPDATVTIAFSSDNINFGEAAQIEHDEVGEQRGDGRTYGAIQYAGRAVAVRLTSDRPLGQVTVLALADGERTVRKVAAPAGKPAHATEAPPVVPRSGWEADESLRFTSSGTEVWPPVFHPVQKLVVHHTAGKNADPDPKATIRSMYYYHAVTQGWGDIGYHFLVSEGGTIYKGRHSHLPGVEADTAMGEDNLGRIVTAGHAYGYNHGSVGIAMLGTLTTKNAEPAARSAVENMLAWEASTHVIDPLGASLYTHPVNGTQRFFPNIAGHRDVPDNATECPGDMFYPTLPALRTRVESMTTGTPYDRMAPGAPTGLTAASGKRSITLKWNAPADTTGLAGYEISRSTSPNGTYSVLGTTTATTYLSSGLQPKTTYYFKVAAYDTAGNRAVASTSGKPS